jgi:TonB-linked SusC/RagA family outer membrane protein
MALVLPFVFFIFGVQLSYALPVEKDEIGIIQQDVKIKGTVIDETNIPIPGVSVIIKGSTTGTVTDINGSFELTAPEGSVLQVSFIGFGTQEIAITNETSVLNIVLAEETENLEEVVIIGYGTQRKETVTGSLSSVSSEELVEQPVGNITQALGGRIPGLISNNSGGRPGKDAATIKIRGISTLNSGEGSNPLLLVDGVERDLDVLSYLDPNEIESVSVLKDASSTAVFGVRGANGVILVTTRRGKIGPAQMSYKATVAAIVPQNTINFLDSYTQSGILNEYQGYSENSSDPTAPYPSDIRDKFKAVIEGNPLEPSDPYFYPSTNYAEVMLKDYTMQTQHNFTISGGTDKVKYFTSLGFFNQGGLFEELNPDLDVSTSYNRYNYRTNLDINVTNTTLAKINIGGSFNKNISLGQSGSEPQSSFYWSAQNHSAPWVGYMYGDKLVMLSDNASFVLLNNDLRGYSVEQENTADYSFSVDQDLDAITKGLSVKANFSLVNYFRNYINRTKDATRRPYYVPERNNDGSVSFYRVKEDVLPTNSTSQSKRRKEYYELSVNYNRKFGDHTVTALALGNASKSHYSMSTFNSIPRSYLGLVSRLTYNFKNRYMAEFNIGYNGSENFAEGKRFGTFPAYSGAWTFSEEPWLKSLIGDEVLSYGKLRYSYGMVGNDRMYIDGSEVRFLYLPESYTLDNRAEQFPVLFGLTGGLSELGVALPGVTGNPNVTWEKSTKINYGVDLSFFENLVSAKFDYFTEDRTDILINQQVVPVYQQTGTLALNLGEVHNEGYEFEIGINHQVNSDLRYWVNLNYTHSRNKIIEIDEPTQPYDYQAQTGTRVGEYYGYMQEDFFRTEDEAMAYRDELWATYSAINPGADMDSYQAYEIFTAGYDVNAGDIKIIDRNNDGLINDADQGYIGRTQFPETMFGAKIGMKYKNWSISALFQGATNYAINTRTSYSPAPAKGSLVDYMEYRYTPERYEAGERIDFPRYLNTNDNWTTMGSYWYDDVTYVRLKNLELSYTFEKSSRFVSRIGMESLRLFASGFNLFTFSTIGVMDPETTNGVMKYPRSRVMNLGVQIQF